MTDVVSELPRLLVLGQVDARTDSLLSQLGDTYCISRSDHVEHGLQELRNDAFAGLLVLGEQTRLTAAALLEAGGILDQIPSGLLLLDPDLRLVWCNKPFRRMAVAEDVAEGMLFYDAFGTPEIPGPDFCPFHTAVGTGEPATSTIRVGDKSYFEVNATPISESTGTESDLLVVVVRDVSDEVHQRQKLNAIYRAGLELGDLTPQEVLDMTVDERVDLLKSRILHYTEDVLEFETVAIRLLDRQTRRLEPLLSVGMDAEAEDRVLFAEAKDNGVTGFVAATGKSYLCEDTGTDPLYITGALGARSSLTVPLILHEEVMGTFNVESPGPGAFDQNDLQFLELFSRELAVALNTLELLVAEKLTTASQSTERILNEVATPVDEILNDAAWVLERYIGHEPSVSERLQRVLQRTREIRQLIHRVGESITPQTAYTQLPERPARPRLKGKRVLVADQDHTVRSAAHELLGRMGCVVETAHNGEEAFLMTRSFHYDVVLADIRPPDMTGYDCFCELRRIHEHLPIILMTGFGYDPSHSIVKARQQGLKAVLYKPFRLNQLLNSVESAVSSPSADG